MDTSETTQLQQEKDTLRRKMQDVRTAIRPAERSAKSREICNALMAQLKASPIKGYEGQPPTIAVYAALRYEVDLDRFIRGAYAANYRIAFPCMIPNDDVAGSICMRSVSCSNYLGGNVPFIVDPRRAWGPVVAEEHQAYTSTPAGATRRFIPSRVKGSVPPKDDARFPMVPAREIGLIIVPALAFDAEGGRLGYGRGSYDRYLRQLNSKCQVLGVAYDELAVEQVPREAHDVTIEKFVTA